MKKFLIGLVVLTVLVLGVVIWLGGKAEQAVPEPGEVRLEIDNVFK